jgi:hypothetical protein
MPLFGLVSGLFRQGGLRATVYALFGGLMLSTLWVTALVSLSAQTNATDLLTEAGAGVLNPFLVKQDLGLTPSVYAQLQASGKAHPTQPLAVPLLKPEPPVLGSEVAGRGYDDGVRLIYSRVASAYYTGGPDAAFAVPDQLKQQLPNFGLFSPNNVPLLPNGPTPAQLPVFLQPLFTFVGLTPTTFTAAGHQNLLDLLPWFWVAAAVLGVLAVALNRSEVKLVALLHGVLHSSWPIVGTLVGLWVATRVDAATFAPYAGMLSVVDRAFLPVYGAAFVLSGAGFLVIKLLPRALTSTQQPGASADGQRPALAGAREQAIAAALERAVGASESAGADTAAHEWTQRRDLATPQPGAAALSATAPTDQPHDDLERIGLAPQQDNPGE